MRAGSRGSNIITLFPADNLSVTVGRLLLTVLVIFSYPLQSHPDRICLDNLYKVGAAAGAARGPGR